MFGWKEQLRALHMLHEEALLLRQQKGKNVHKIPFITCMTLYLWKYLTRFQKVISCIVICSAIFMKKCKPTSLHLLHFKYGNMLLL